VAEQFGVSKSALSRHRKACLAPQVQAAARLLAPAAAKEEVERAKAIARGEVTPNVEDVMTLTGLMSRIAGSLERLEGAAGRADGDNAYAALAALSGQIYRGIETAAKLSGVCQDHAEPNRPAFSVTINLPPTSQPEMPAIAHVPGNQRSREGATLECPVWKSGVADRNIS
jgi:hypothetical protein